MKRPTDWRPEQGFALLIVLWCLGLLALMASVLTAGARTETRLAASLRASAAAEAAADGAVHEATLRLLQGSWTPGSGPHRLRIGRTLVDVTLEDEAGKFNPNFITQPRLQALLRAVGADAPTALVLAAHLTDWRTASTFSLLGGQKTDLYRAAGLPYGPPNRPFTDPNELELVLGMTPDLLARLKPLLSVYNEGEVQQAAGGDVVGQTLAEARLTPTAVDSRAFTSPYRVSLIRAIAMVSGGGRFERRAVVRIKAAPQPEDAPFQIMTWDSGEG